MSFNPVRPSPFGPLIGPNQKKKPMGSSFSFPSPFPFPFSPLLRLRRGKVSRAAPKPQVLAYEKNRRPSSRPTPNPVRRRQRKSPRLLLISAANLRCFSDESAVKPHRNQGESGLLPFPFLPVARGVGFHGN